MSDIAESTVDPSVAGRCVIARVGLFLAVSDCDAPPISVIAQRLEAALRNDERVTAAVLDDVVDEDWSNLWTVYSPFEDHDPDEAGRAFRTPRHQHAVALSAPINFKARVLAKNQRHLLPSEVVPEDYYVKWDGTVAVICWEQSAQDDIPMSGGHVIEEILREVCRRAGLDLLTQRCSSDCDYTLLHRSIRLLPSSEPHKDVVLLPTASDYNVIDAITPSVGLDEMAADFYAHAAVTCLAFAEMKNEGEHLVAIDHLARHSLSELLDTQYERATIEAASFVKSCRQRWRTRRWKREARKLVAQLWLAVASIELISREWNRHRNEFESSANRQGLLDLFAGDYGRDAAYVSSVEVARLVDAIQHSGAFLEARAMTAVTAWAALAGAIAGALTTGAVALLSAAL